MSIRTRSMFALLLILAAALGCDGGDEPAPDLLARDDATLRTTTLGTVVGGRSAHGAHAWRGIPFAAPPLAARRWRGPAPAEPHDGVLEALTHGSPCPQFATFAGGPDGVGPGEPYGDEDCLYLNVFAPPFPADAVPDGEARLPVMLWIHGGGNSIGSASTYDGSVLATRGDVIVVAVQYRLGPFGWFRHPELREGASDLDASGNFGTLDLIAALRWVRDNIAAFGGDPGNVTVFGESAGGTNTYTMLLSPQAEGLFHRAIVQSGTPRFAPPLEGEDPAADPAASGNTSSEVVARLRENGDLGSDAAFADGIRAVPTERVLAAYAGQRGLGMINMPKVFAEGTVLPTEDVYEALRAGRYNAVPTILGSNRDESKLCPDLRSASRRLGHGDSPVGPRLVGLRPGVRVLDQVGQARGRRRARAPPWPPHSAPPSTPTVSTGTSCPTSDGSTSPACWARRTPSRSRSCSATSTSAASVDSDSPKRTHPPA